MSSPIVPAGRNWQNEASRLKAAGYAMSRNPVMARLEAAKVADSIGRGSLVDIANRKMTADMNRRRLAGTRLAAGTTRIASDMQMAMPKMRNPVGNLMEKGIPFNVNDPKELIELRRWCRLFYATHPLVPLLIDIYSKFPVTGLEFQSKDPLIEKFYTEMFLDDLNYEEFLPDAIGREYFISGEVTTLAHFNEQLGIWSSEEVLNPDMVAVSKSLFVEEERVQLLVKELVETLRMGPQGQPDSQERPSERLERTFEYQQLVKYYPEILSAAARDDGLDINDALVSRIVNKASPWDLRGTPFLLRSFRTLMQEQSLLAAQDAVADRLYAPMVLATMGVENMGNDEPWIPGPAELDELRDDLQSALAADFKLLVHNMGVKVESVFGRESVPNFDSDFDRIDAQLLQAWGIGQALIMGGTGAGGAYASSALNREVCEQLMVGFQKKIIRHMRKRMEIIAEAQEHYDYELKGGLRVPLYREIVVEDPDTGESYIKRVPKLLIPDVKFATLNLRDETQERMFIQQLKASGVPISDKFLAVNVAIDFEQELEREAQETVDKGMAKAQAFKKMQDLCDLEGLPYPPELAAHLEATLQLRELLAQTKTLEDQAKQMDLQTQAASPAAQTGALPGSTPAAGYPGGPPLQYDEKGQVLPAEDQQGATPPTVSSPSSPPMTDPSQAAPSGGSEVARNRTRPAESDEQRANSPRAAGRKTAAERWSDRVHSYQKERYSNRFTAGPSSLGHARKTSPDEVMAAVQRRAIWHDETPVLSKLVRDPNFYRTINAGHLRNQIESDWPEIRAGGAKESRELLADMVEHYEDATGVKVLWD